MHSFTQNYHSTASSVTNEVNGVRAFPLPSTCFPHAKANTRPSGSWNHQNFPFVGAQGQFKKSPLCFYSWRCLRDIVHYLVHNGDADDKRHVHANQRKMLSAFTTTTQSLSVHQSTTRYFGLSINLLMNPAITMSLCAKNEIWEHRSISFSEMTYRNPLLMELSNKVAPTTIWAWLKTKCP